MRKLSEFETQQHAERLVDTLLVEEIDSEVRGEDPWEVWVYANEHMQAARDRLASFDPEAGPQAGRDAQRIRTRRERDEDLARRRHVEVSAAWRDEGERKLGPVTIFLIACSMLVAYNTGFDNPLGSSVVQALSIEPWLSTGTLAEIRAGELWRLVTPMWIHFSLMHIAFNSMWLWRLGQDIEARHGSLALVAIVLLAQIPSGLGQYLATGPNFGGMSGVVYGLFGFVWMQSRYNRRRGYALGDDIVVIMTIWFVICLTGIVGPIANIGHAGGLIAGLAAGAPAYLSHRRAHGQAQALRMGEGDEGASALTRGWRGLVRRYLNPYAPAWLLALALLGIAVDLL